jgi:hypothetical protein
MSFDIARSSDAPSRAKDMIDKIRRYDLRQSHQQRICGVMTGPLGRFSLASQNWHCRTELGPGPRRRKIVTCGRRLAAAPCAN